MASIFIVAHCYDNNNRHINAKIIGMQDTLITYGMLYRCFQQDIHIEDLCGEKMMINSTLTNI
jgi:hypothetical protein